MTRSDSVRSTFNSRSVSTSPRNGNTTGLCKHNYQVSVKGLRDLESSLGGLEMASQITYVIWEQPWLSSMTRPHFLHRRHFFLFINFSNGVSSGDRHLPLWALPLHFLHVCTPHLQVPTVFKVKNGQNPVLGEIYREQVKSEQYVRSGSLSSVALFFCSWTNAGPIIFFMSEPSIGLWQHWEGNKDSSAKDFVTMRIKQCLQ